MGKFQILNLKPSKSEEWPEEVGQEFIEKLLKLAPDDHQLEQKGVVIINGVSASVINSGSGFSWIKMGEVNDEKTWRIDVLFPVNASIVKLDHGKLSPTEQVLENELPVELTRDYPFLNWFNLKSDNHKIVMAVPVLERIFKAKDITGNKIYEYSLKTTYKTHKGLIPRSAFVQIIPEDDPLARIKKVSEDQWEMTCYDALTAPQPSRFEEEMIYYTLIFCSGFIMFTFIIVYIMIFF